ncbi:MAG: hypothetical protein Ct9H300mP32_1700 [Verrucomicrobiota bacterium]|nr:MAG: hypothetical protein Ct9H300mP32_1700 [Verrucomicrobiota bacterium]
MKLGSQCQPQAALGRPLSGPSVDCESTQIFKKQHAVVRQTAQAGGRRALRTELAKGDVGTVFGQPATSSTSPGRTAITATSRSSRSLRRSSSPRRWGYLPRSHPGRTFGPGRQHRVKRIARALNGSSGSRKNRRCALRSKTAGQGTCLGHQIRHLAKSSIESNSQSGSASALTQPISSPPVTTSARPEAGTPPLRGGQMIGLGQVLAFHLNDSKTGLNSRVDRHDHIGHG